MVFPIYSIRDKLVGFQGVSLHHNDAVAMRNFEEAFNDAPHAEDYSLYKLGTFDTNTGIVSSLKEPEIVCTGFDIKEK